MTNKYRNKFFTGMTAEQKRNKWQNFDCQPSYVKEFLWEYEGNIWPSSSAPLSPASIERAYRKHLANLINI